MPGHCPSVPRKSRENSSYKRLPVSQKSYGKVNYSDNYFQIYFTELIHDSNIFWHWLQLVNTPDKIMLTEPIQAYKLDGYQVYCGKNNH